MLRLSKILNAAQDALRSQRIFISPTFERLEAEPVLESLDVLKEDVVIDVELGIVLIGREVALPLARSLLTASL